MVESKMSKFKFRLERILKYKEQIEEEKKRNLAVVQNRLFQEKNKLSTFMATRNKYMSLFGVRKTGRVNLRDLIISKRYIDKLSGDIVVQTKIVKSAEGEVSAAQKILLEAAREKKKYEKLRIKQLDKHTKEDILKENKELDEFGSRISERNLSGSLHQ
jgi:flagellar protein FliJ